MLSRRSFTLTIVCLTFLAALPFVIHRSVQGTGSTLKWIPALKSKPVNSCPDKLDWLSSLNVAYPVRYAHRDIRVVPNRDMAHGTLSKVDEKFLPDFETIDLSTDSSVKLKNCKDPLVLETPVYSAEAIDASHIIFGVSTTLKRLQMSIPQLLRWLPNTYAQLFAIVVASEDFNDTDKTVFATSAEKEALQSRMRDLGLDVTILDPFESKDVSSEKYFSLIKLLHDQAGEKTLWISIIEDDTFIPSMPALVAMLGKYNAKKQHYIGSLPEDWSTVTRDGLMAVRGAGIFISRPLSRILFENYDTCKNSSGSSAGDFRIMECVYQSTTIKLTNERELHQIDLGGDLSGIFESGQSLLSIRLCNLTDTGQGGWSLAMMNTIADVCKGCFLHRWQFGADTLLSSGFSISFYPNGHLNKINLDLIEATWDPAPPVEYSANWGTEHSFGQSRPKLVLNKDKIQFRLIASANVDGGVRQAYYHPGVNGEMDSLLDLFWSSSKKM